MTVHGAAVDRIWFGTSAWRWPLMPLSALFALIGALRRRLYRQGILEIPGLDTPVLVVGNITAGGTGKTPIALWLAAALKDRGRRPGIVSRGYRGRLGPHPKRVLPDSDPAIVGDEPLMMERRQVCPVVVHPDRVAAARLLAAMGCDVIVADDGLQHYRLQRHYEIAVVDGERGFGNGLLLPAGPLRERPARLSAVDRILIQCTAGGEVISAATLPPAVPAARFKLKPGAVCRLGDGHQATLEDFRGRAVHAVAAIAHPARFFRMLEAHGIDVVPHAHRDHAKLEAADLEFADGLDVLMTEKDAARCRGAAGPNCWYVTVEADFADDSTSAWLDSVCRDLDERGARPVP